jgi:hypothetical protein
VLAHAKWESPQHGYRLMRAEPYTGEREGLCSPAWNDAAMSRVPASNPSAPPLKRLTGRIASRFRPSASLASTQAPSAAQMYSSGWTNGFLLAKEMDLFFLVRGNEARFSHMRTVIVNMGALEPKDCFSGSEYLHHRFFMEKWTDHLIELLRDAVFYLRDWVLLAEIHGVQQEFITVLAKRAFELSRSISEECLDLAQSVCFSKSEHALVAITSTVNSSDGWVHPQHVSFDSHTCI